MIVLFIANNNCFKINKIILKIKPQKKNIYFFKNENFIKNKHFKYFYKNHKVNFISNKFWKKQNL